MKTATNEVKVAVALAGAAAMEAFIVALEQSGEDRLALMDHVDELLPTGLDINRPVRDWAAGLFDATGPAAVPEHRSHIADRDDLPRVPSQRSTRGNLHDRLRAAGVPAPVDPYPPLHLTRARSRELHIERLPFWRRWFTW